MSLNLPLGPVMTDVTGLALDAEDIRRLSHPLVGGVILFARNYESPEQLQRLTASIHALRSPPLPICVDHEGGRVQRFRKGFTTIPPMRELGKLWDRSRIEARAAARAIGVIIGYELASHGVDFTFAPVLDIDYGESTVIGHRAFHSDPVAVSALARSLMLGLNEAGVTNVGKHFPGHGFVRADSHHEIPVDDREYSEIWDKDMLPFRELSDGTMGGVMPAHVTYPRFDSKPAGFSEKWLQEVLRGKLGFDGVIFSDDLSMEGASVAGGVVSRANAALTAGCDVVLICNDPAKADELLTGLSASNLAISGDLARRLDSLRCKSREQQCQDARDMLADAGLATTQH